MGALDFKFRMIYQFRLLFIKIKKVVLEYCKSLLTNRCPSDGYESDIDIKRRLHEKRMIEVVKDDTAGMNIDIFNKSLKELWRSKRSKYEFILRGGYSLKNALFHLYKLCGKGNNSRRLE